MNLRRIIVALALVVSVASSAQDMTSVFVDAVSLYNSNQYGRSKELLENVIKKEPANDAAYYYLALCEASLKDADSAIAHLKKAVEIDPSNYWYRERLAMVYEMKGEFDLVIQMYESILKDNPKKTDIYYELLNLYVRQKQFDKALSTLDAIEMEVGMDEQITRTRYEMLRDLGRNEEALKALEDYNAKYSSPAVLSMMGDYYLSEYNDSLALASYTEALSIQSDYIPAVLGESEVYRITRKYNKYFESLDKFIKDPNTPAVSKSMYISNVTRSLDPKFILGHLSDYDSLVNECVNIHPTDSSVLSTAAFYYLSTQRKDPAKEYLQKNYDLYPESISAAASYVDALSYMEDWETLKKISSEGYRRFPNEGAFLEYNSIASYNLKDYEGVIANAEEILKKFPSDTSKTLRAYSTIGDMYHSLGNDKAAYKAYDKALKINKNYAPVLNNYAWYLCQSGKKLKKAYQLSKKTVELEPDNATYLDTFGWILHLQGKDIEAKPFFKHALLYGGKDSAVILAHYAEVLYKLKEYDLAKVYWDQAIKKNNGEIIDLEKKVAEKLKAVGK